MIVQYELNVNCLLTIYKHWSHGKGISAYCITINGQRIFYLMMMHVNGSIQKVTDELRGRIPEGDMHKLVCCNINNFGKEDIISGKSSDVKSA